jgi:hypothetical protein
VRLAGIPMPVTILANMYIDVLEMPLHIALLDAENSKKRQRVAPMVIDPYPALKRRDVFKALSARGTVVGQYIVHAMHGKFSDHPGFKLLSASYVPPKTCEMCVCVCVCVLLRARGRGREREREREREKDKERDVSLGSLPASHLLCQCTQHLHLFCL